MNFSQEYKWFLLQSRVDLPSRIDIAIARSRFSRTIVRDYTFHFLSEIFVLQGLWWSGVDFRISGWVGRQLEPETTVQFQFLMEEFS